MRSALPPPTVSAPATAVRPAPTARPTSVVSVAPLRARAIGRPTRRASVVPRATSNDIKNGTTILIDGVPWKITEFLHVKPGKGSAFVRTKMKARGGRKRWGGDGASAAGRRRFIEFRGSRRDFFWDFCC